MTNERSAPADPRVDSFNDEVIGPAPDPAALAAFRPGQVKLGPVFVLMGIIVCIVTGGVLLATLGSGHEATPHTGKSASGLGVEAAAPLLKPITSPGYPPTDVLRAIVVPQGSTRRSTNDEDAGSSTYDRSATFANAAKPSVVLAFYSLELARAGWSKVEQVAPATGTGTELLATRASSDGYYWQIGVTVRQASGSLSAALAGGSPTPTSSFEIRLEEVDDES